MAMGRRQHRERQEDLWVAHTQLATAPGHPFYERLNAVLDAEGFDRFVEDLCAKFYAPQFGRPSLTPGIYFRSLLIGYFEGIGAERGIAWRLADSLALRRFVGIALEEETPDHSTISRTRRLIDLDTHAAVFAWVLEVLARRGLIVGKRVAIDATTLEANAAMCSIVRRDTGASYEEFLTGLAKASGIETPTREDLAVGPQAQDAHLE
jgi:transposase